MWFESHIIIHFYIIIAITAVACQAQNTNSSSNNSAASNSKETIDYSSLKIITPTGAPAFAFYAQANNPNFETNSVATNIVAMMGQGSYDVIVLPTNAGVAAINKGVNYQIAATVTFGNLFVASTGNDEDGKMDEDDSIILFQQGNVPDKIFHYVYGDAFDKSVEYVADASEAAKCLLTGKNMANNNEPVDYVLMAEPALTTVLSNDKGATYGKAAIYANLQEEYNKKANGLDLFQASVFVNKSSDVNKIKALLTDTETSIKEAIKDSNKITDALNSLEDPATKYGVNPTVAANVLKKNNGMGLGFKYAYENKDAIDNFLSVFGMGATSEEVYFK